MLGRIQLSVKPSTTMADLSGMCAAEGIKGYDVGPPNGDYHTIFLSVESPQIDSLRNRVVEGQYGFIKNFYVEGETQSLRR